ncbi:MAG: hypothetical protein LBS57_09155 [Treponema sp.]|jgi:hypothetical protein|nr:hypothetical protein [Treponema sp.]
MESRLDFENYAFRSEDGISMARTQAERELYLREKVQRPQDRVMKTFDLTEAGLAAFFTTLMEDSYVLVEATITTFTFVRRRWEAQ